MTKYLNDRREQHPVAHVAMIFGMLNPMLLVVLGGGLLILAAVLFPIVVQTPAANPQACC